MRSVRFMIGLITMTAAVLLAQPTAQHGAPQTLHTTTIQTEIDDVLGSGHYSTLTAPEASAASTRRAVVRVVNNSRYTVRFLEKGPTPELHPIQPGGSREMIVSPGDYEIVAKLEGSDALALYRKQTYGSATKYVFRFR